MTTIGLTKLIIIQEIISYQLIEQKETKRTHFVSINRTNKNTKLPEHCCVYSYKLQLPHNT
jgi:hypothetical protein